MDFHSLIRFVGRSIHSYNPSWFENDINIFISFIAFVIDFINNFKICILEIYNCTYKNS